jgi:hypothetical protein
MSLRRALSGHSTPRLESRCKLVGTTPALAVRAVIEPDGVARILEVVA